MDRLLAVVRGPRVSAEGEDQLVPLVTVANHHSCMDEPLLWGGVLTVKVGNSKIIK